MIYTVSINRNTDFKRMYYRAKYKNGFLIVVYLTKNRLKKARLGITVSKKVGNAVVRNRVRRIIKAAYVDLEKQENLRGLDIVIVAKHPCSQVKTQKVYRELKKNINFLRKKWIFIFSCRAVNVCA